jgi:hypothetical protein
MWVNLDCASTSVQFHAWPFWSGNCLLNKTVDSIDNGMYALPSHALCPFQQGVHIRQLSPIPGLFQNSPAAPRSQGCHCLHSADEFWC